MTGLVTSSCQQPRPKETLFKTWQVRDDCSELILSLILKKNQWNLLLRTEYKEETKKEQVAFQPSTESNYTIYRAVQYKFREVANETFGASDVKKMGNWNT